MVEVRKANLAIEGTESHQLEVNSDPALGGNESALEQRKGNAEILPPYPFTLPI